MNALTVQPSKEPVCFICKGDEPPVSDGRRAVSCPGCKALIHRTCARDLKKMQSGAKNAKN